MFLLMSKVVVDMSEQGIGIGFTEGTGREDSGRGGKDRLAE